MRILKIAGVGLLALCVAAAGGWWAIGPVWRTFLSDPPANDDVLFWTQSQRDTGFMIAGHLPMINVIPIEAGETTRPLPDGPPLALDLDIDAFMASQNAASLVVLHKGEVRLERYGLHQTPDGVWTSFSVAKSITSSLLGAALKDGDIRSLDDTVSDYIDGLKGSAYDDVTIHQLLTMTSGVRWTEDYGDPNSDVALFTNIEPTPGEPTIVSYLKTLPRAHPPGTVFNYSTGETNLVGVLISAATGKTLPAYLSEKIWRPYGMAEDASWVVSASGEAISGCCVQATARDFARFGQFILEDGVIDGAPVFPDGWVETATSMQVPLPDDPIRDYGYQWWIADEGAFFATGIFGQGIYIDPARDLVIATNNSWRDARGQETGQAAERRAFYNAVRAAIDKEG